MTTIKSAKLPYVRPDAALVSLKPERSLVDDRYQHRKDSLIIPCKRQ